MSIPSGAPNQDWREMERQARELRRAARRARHDERREWRNQSRARTPYNTTEASCGLAHVGPYSSERCPLYRSRNGRIFGVCRGLATHLAVPVFWVRFAAVAAMLFTGIWPMVGAYIVAALLIKPEPMIPFKEESDQEFYDSYVNSRGLAVQRLKRTYDNIERRIRRMENIVTARDYDWEQRLNETT